MAIEMHPIGVIHTPFKLLKGMPIQPRGAEGVKGEIEIFEPFRAGLRDLDGFSHVQLLYLFHESRGFKMEVVPFMDTEVRGLFATRAPRRPNPIGLSTVRLMNVHETGFDVQDIDILDGTPLLDIKPYVPAFDEAQQVSTGWLESVAHTVKRRRSDGRFTD